MSSFRIGVTQPTIASDVGENGREIRRLMREGAASGARLLQFPEGALSGYPKAQIESWVDVDWAAVRQEVEEVGTLAAELSIWIVLGSAHPLTSPTQPHNSLYVISDTGRVVDRYDKRFCSSTEITKFFSPGFEPVVFDVDGFRFGCALCFEVNFPELFMEYEQLGVDCLLLSSYDNAPVSETKARAYASVYDYWVALSVPQQSPQLLSSGLIGPDGSQLVPVAGDAELAVGTMDRDDPAFDVALNRERPWRAKARDGSVYRRRRVDDPRSADRTCI